MLLRLQLLPIKYYKAEMYQFRRCAFPENFSVFKTSHNPSLKIGIHFPCFCPHGQFTRESFFILWEITNNPCFPCFFVFVGTLPHWILYQDFPPVDDIIRIADDMLYLV